MVGVVSGSIDANTLPKFKAAVETHLMDKPSFVVIDSTDLRYVNSSGIGVLIKMAIEFANVGGLYCMVSVPQKIQSLFKVLGILDVLKIYDNPESALEDIKARFGKKEALKPAAHARQYPLLIQCIGCGRRIEIPSDGYFSCPRCATYFSVKKEGKIKGYKIDRPIHAELTMPASPEMARGLRAVAEGLADLRRYSKPTVQRIHQMLDETATILSLGRSVDGEVFVIYLVADSKEFRVAIKTSRNVFDRKASPQISDNLQVIRGLVDEMEIITLPMGGQILKLVSKAAEDAPDQT